MWDNKRYKCNNKHSNTTLVKVKCYLYPSYTPQFHIQIQLLLKLNTMATYFLIPPQNSNITLVKVKLTPEEKKQGPWTNSNTTLVKVKYKNKVGVTTKK